VHDAARVDVCHAFCHLHRRAQQAVQAGAPRAGVVRALLQRHPQRACTKTECSVGNHHAIGTLAGRSSSQQWSMGKIKACMRQQCSPASQNSMTKMQR
jgi:uncharacterized membrane protein YebE (DUF533 family)